MDERPRLDSQPFRRFAHHLFHLWLIEGGGGVERGGKRADVAKEVGHTQMFLDRRRFILDRIRQERCCLLDEIGQSLRARSEQLQQTVEGCLVA